MLRASSMLIRSRGSASVAAAAMCSTSIVAQSAPAFLATTPHCRKLMGTPHASSRSVAPRGGAAASRSSSRSPLDDPNTKAKVAEAMRMLEAMRNRRPGDPNPLEQGEDDESDIPDGLLGSAEDTAEARAEYHTSQLEEEQESARLRHWDVTAWIRGGEAAPGRVLDVNPDDEPLSARERAVILAELSIDLPRLMADFAPLRDAGFTDDGRPLDSFEPINVPETIPPTNSAAERQTYEQVKRDALAVNAASKWIPCSSLEDLLAVQDRHRPPKNAQVEEAAKAEDAGDVEMTARADAVRKRFASLVTYASWMVTRVQLLLDSPVGWEADDSVRYRFAAEQLQRAYLCALQSLAYSAVHALPLMIRMDSPAFDAMVRQSWTQLAWITSRLSHMQDESLLIYDHLQQWSDDDRKAGIAEAQAQGAYNVLEAGAPLPESAGLMRDVAAVHAFCGAWGASILAEHNHLVDCASRATHWAQALKENLTAEAPEYGLQHYAGEALPALTRISHALLQYPNKEDRALQKLWKTLPEGQSAPLGEDGVTPLPQPHYRDVLGAVHAAQFAVGAVWRFANLLDHKKMQLKVHLAEAAARQKLLDIRQELEEGKPGAPGSKPKHVLQSEASALELASDRLALHLAQYGAKMSERLAMQHASWASEGDLNSRGLYETAIMQSKRCASLRRGLDVFLHFMDRVSPLGKEAERHLWSLPTLTIQADAAAAHQQLGEAIQNWIEEEKEIKEALSTNDAKGIEDAPASKKDDAAATAAAAAKPADPDAPLTSAELDKLAHCAALSFETARRLIALVPRTQAAINVHDELEAVPQTELDELIEQAKTDSLPRM